MTSFQAAGFPFAGTDITRAWAGIKLSPLNVTALLELQRKNAVALTAANQIACDGLTRLAERQGDLIRSTVDDCGKATSDVLLAATSLEEKATRQTDAARQIYASAVAGFRELSDIAVRANLAAVDVLNARIAEAFDDFKALIATSGPVAEGDAPRVPAVVEPVNITGQAAAAPVELQVTPTTPDAEVQPAVVEPEPTVSPKARVTASPKKAPLKPRRRPPVRS
jgi:phasin family protein